LGPLVVGDFADRDALSRTLIEYEIEAVIHFAAYTYVGESVVNPRKYFRNNVTNTLNLLEAMLDCTVKHIVFSSTCATYGRPATLPITEEHPQRPINSYGESKLMVEKALHWFSNAYEMRWAALRYFNAAGADPDGEIGEYHDPETHLVPNAIRAALGLGPALEVYGTDHPPPHVFIDPLSSVRLRAVDGTAASVNLPLVGWRGKQYKNGIRSAHDDANAAHAIDEMSPTSTTIHAGIVACAMGLRTA
jgi:nucleoside-diphosphate-sugar epimerase